MKMKDLDEDQTKLVNAFMKVLEKWAKLNKLVITEVKGWTEPTIIWMALNDRKCHCVPKERKCPCKEGLEECRTMGDHECRCSVFKQA